VLTVCEHLLDEDQVQLFGGGGTKTYGDIADDH